MAGQTMVRLCADRTQAKRAGLDQASGLNASACQRSEGTKEAHQARDSRREAQCAARQRVCPGRAQRSASRHRVDGHGRKRQQRAVLDGESAVIQRREQQGLPSPHPQKRRMGKSSAQALKGRRRKGIKAEWPLLGTRRVAQPASPTAVAGTHKP